MLYSQALRVAAERAALPGSRAEGQDRDPPDLNEVGKAGFTENAPHERS